MWLPMRVVDHLIDSALAAECTRKKIVPGTGAFHKDLQLEPAAVRGWARARTAVTSLDDARAASVALAGSLCVGPIAHERQLIVAAQPAWGPPDDH